MMDDYALKLLASMLLGLSFEDMEFVAANIHERLPEEEISESDIAHALIEMAKEIRDGETT